MKKIFIIAIFILLSAITLFSQTCEWAEGIVGDNLDPKAYIKVDNIGNVYIVGVFQADTLKFNNDIKLINHTIQSRMVNSYIAKYNSLGVCQWAEKLQSPYSVYLYSLVLDASGNIFITGECYGDTLYFNNGISLSNNISMFGYLAKYNSDGVCQWVAKQTGAKNNYVNVDVLGNLYLAGYTRSDTLNFGNGITIFKIGKKNSCDAFITKYNSLGICQWAEKFVSIEDDYARCLVIDSSGNILVIGNYFYTDTLNFNNGKLLTDKNPFKTFIAKYNSAGICQWAEKIVGDSDPRSIVIDEYGNIYFAGTLYSDTLIFNNNITLIDYSSAKGYIVKYNSAGICQWANKIAGYNGATIYYLAIDILRNIYAAGIFTSTYLYFNNGVTLFNSEAGDGYIAKYNSAGKCQWAEKIGGDKNDYLQSIAVDVLGNIYVSGYFESTKIFFNNNKSITNRASRECFIAKYNSIPNSVINEPIQNHISIYPNPATDYIEIKPSEGSDILIYNTLGEIVLSVEQTPPAVHRINISNLTPGMYFIKIGNKVEKFVKI